jgi:hypothetical protein
MGTWFRIPRLLSLQSARKGRASYRPALQNLEDRCLLSASIVGSLTQPPPLTASTVPGNGDVNPYGVAFVPSNFAKGGPLKPGDILVSNFNNSANVQGTGTTIVEIHPNGALSPFFKGRQPFGLTTALGILSRGFVLVGNLPTDANGNPEQGSLLIIDRNGHLVETLADAKFLDGPWDLAVNDQGATAQVFVSNVLSGTVTRLNLNVPNDGSAPVVTSMTQTRQDISSDPIQRHSSSARPVWLTMSARTFSTWHRQVITRFSRSQTPEVRTWMLDKASWFTKMMFIYTAPWAFCRLPMAISSALKATPSIRTRTSPAKLWSLPLRASSWPRCRSIQAGTGGSVRDCPGVE